MERLTRNPRRLLVAAGLILLAGLLAPARAQAADIRSGDEIVVRSDEVIDDDLYASANRITIDGTVRGDVVVIGQQVTVNGTIEGDLIAAAQVVEINGIVNDHARLAAQVIRMGPQAHVSHTVMAASYSLEQQAGSTTGGDLVYGGFQALVAGNVARDVAGSMRSLTIDGTVGRNVNVNVGSKSADAQANVYVPASPVQIPVIPPGLTLGDSARIGGQLEYQSTSTGDISPQAQVQGRVLQMAPPAAVAQPAPSAGAVFASAVVDNLRRFVALLLVGLLLLWVVPGTVSNLANIAQRRPLPSLGWGIVSVLVFGVAVIAVVFIAVILAVLLGIVTLGELVLPVLSLGAIADIALVVGFVLFVSYVAQVIASYWGGRWILQRVQPTWAAGRVWPFVIGLVLFVLLTAIPIVGGLIGLIAALVVLGALWSWFWSRGSEQPVPTQATAATL